MTMAKDNKFMGHTIFRAPQDYAQTGQPAAPPIGISGPLVNKPAGKSPNFSNMRAAKDYIRVAHRLKDEG